jgi:hypothetical protein
MKKALLNGHSQKIGEIFQSLARLSGVPVASHVALPRPPALPHPPSVAIGQPYVSSVKK